MNLVTKLSLIGTLVPLTGCGAREPDRVAGGAASGAIVGAIGVGAGAAIGTEDVAGAVTSPRQVNLGTPVCQT